MHAMRYLVLSLSALGLLLAYSCRSPKPEAPERLRTSYAPLDRQLRRMVPVDSFTLSPAEAQALPGAVFLDARERAEYETSHLPGARYLGYSRPDTAAVDSLSRDTPLVVYCTVGYRSARLAQELRQAGFQQVYNLYGSIYAWRLAGLPLVDAAGPTENIHTFNRKWGRFIPDTLGTKVY